MCPGRNSQRRKIDLGIQTHVNGRAKIEPISTPEMRCNVAGSRIISDIFLTKHLFRIRLHTTHKDDYTLEEILSHIKNNLWSCGRNNGLNLRLTIDISAPRPISSSCLWWMKAASLYIKTVLHTNTLLQKKTLFLKISVNLIVFHGLQIFSIE